MDREKVIKGLQCIVDGSVRCESCGYAIDKHGHHSCHQDCAKDAIALLKEDCHNCKLECLLQKYNQLKEKYDKLLKEQEKAKVVFGRCKDGSFATECGHCGMYLDKAYSICPKCNKELDWNSNQD